jgi:hypothetical protein
MAVALGLLAAEAEQGGGLRPAQLFGLEQGELRLGTLEACLVDIAELVHPASTVGDASGLRRAQSAQVKIGDASFVQARRQQLLGKPARRELATSRVSITRLTPSVRRPAISPGSVVRSYPTVKNVFRGMTQR